MHIHISYGELALYGIIGAGLYAWFHTSRKRKRELADDALKMAGLQRRNAAQQEQTQQAWASRSGKTTTSLHRKSLTPQQVVMAVVRGRNSLHRPNISRVRPGISSNHLNRSSRRLLFMMTAVF